MKDIWLCLCFLLKIICLLLVQSHATQSHTPGELDKPADFQCGRRRLHNNWKTDPISGVFLPEDTGSVVDGVSEPRGWPWHAAVFETTSLASPRYLCGATLISRDLVLTAAHCISTRKVENVSVGLGKHNIACHDTDESVVVEVRSIIIPERFLIHALIDDIGLLRLKSKVQFTDAIRPACLWHRRRSALSGDNMSGVLAGWGYNNDNIVSESLQQVNLPIVSDMTCIRSFRSTAAFARLLYGKTFCAGYLNNGTSPCTGDSGGALQVFVPDEIESKNGIVTGAWYVRGVLSVGVKTDSLQCDSYTVYTDEAKFSDWIDSYLGD